MENRDRIIRILAALRAKFAEGSGCTEHEAEVAFQRYNELMQQYNLEETDIHIKQSGVGKTKHTVREDGRKQMPPIVFCIRPISVLTDTRGVYDKRDGTVTFYGTQADRDYAEFLLRVCQRTIDTAWNAYRYSWDYTKLKKQGEHGRSIRHAFTTVVVERLSERMLELARMNKQKGIGTSLIVLKHELIQHMMDQEGTKTSTKAVTKSYHGYDTAIRSALDAANAAQLQHQAGNDTKLITNGGK